MIPFIIFFILWTAFFIFFSIQFYNIVFRGFAPFISTKSKIIKEIIENLEIREDSVIYELGCGQANFLGAIGKRYKKVKMFGIEYSFLPYLLAQLQDVFVKNNITILKRNFFKVDLSKADIIYCYLNLDTMRRLEEKFRKECKKGAVVVSCSFPLPNIKPGKVMKKEKKNIYFYYF